MELNRNESNPTLATFDPGNICNLACSTCTETHSTRWQALKNLPIESHAFNQTVDDLDFTGIEHIVIGGGEPILHKSTHAVLEKFKNTDMRFLIHFNGTVKPSLEFLNTCSYYKSISICFSIDGVGEHFEYLRWPAKWTKVDSNVKWIVEHAPDSVEFAVNITISELNRTTHKLVIDWAKVTLPEDHYISYNYAGTNITTFDKVDKLRGTDWRKTFDSINTAAQ
jgi:MoaA/NifB/PqqE/SkfB family radical SAM enzyme